MPAAVVATTTGPDRTPAVAWWVAFLMLFFSVLGMMDRTIITMLVEPIQKDLGLTDFQMSIVLGPAYALSYALATLPLGWAADRFPRRVVIASGVFGWSVATFGCGLARTFTGLFGCRVGVGMGEAALMPAAYTLLAEKFPKRRLTTAMGIIGTGPKLGSSAAFAFGAWLFIASPPSGRLVLPVVGDIAVWEAAFLILGVLGLITAPLCFTFGELKRPAVTTKTPRNEDLLPFLRARWNPVVVTILGFGLVAMGAAALSVWAPTYMSRQHGWGPGRYGPILSLISLCTATTVVLKGLVVDWLFGRGMLDAHVRFYTWLLAAAIPIMAAAFLLDRPLVFLILYGVANIAAMTFMVYLSSVLQLITPRRLRGQISALALLTMAGISAGISPMLVAVLTDFVFRDPAALGLSMAIVSLTAFVLALVMLRCVMRPVREIIASGEATRDDPGPASLAARDPAFSPARGAI